MNHFTGFDFMTGDLDGESGQHMIGNQDEQLRQMREVANSWSLSTWMYIEVLGA